MIEHDNEIEAKFDAPAVSVEDFKKFLMSHEDLEVVRFETVESPDVYYQSGPNVLRHRLLDPAAQRHELTVKRRKTEKSTRDREEIDLLLDAKVPYGAVGDLLRAVGFQVVLDITKKCHIFWVRLSPNLMGTFVVYDVWETPNPKVRRRFIEVEAEKGSGVTPETAKRHVNLWVANLQGRFKLGEPLNDSLYEIYSGNRYQTV